MSWYDMEDWSCHVTTMAHLIPSDGTPLTEEWVEETISRFVAMQGLATTPLRCPYLTGYCIEEVDGVPALAVGVTDAVTGAGSEDELEEYTMKVVGNWEDALHSIDGAEVVEDEVMHMQSAAQVEYWYDADAARDAYLDCNGGE